MKNILFTGDTLSDEARAAFAAKGYNFIAASYDLSEDEVAKLLCDCDGYILGGDEIASESMLSKAGNRLKAISFFGAGYERYIDVKYAKSKGIMVANTPGANADSVAEFTVALLLSATKNVVKCNNETKSAVWNRPKTFDIQGKVIGIIGMGTIGTKSARILNKGFGCKILYSGNTKKADIDKELGSKFVSLEELLKQSDCILIHAAYSEATKNMINKSNIGLLKKNAVLINTARAELVDEDALLDALQNGSILRAAFDAFYEEPVNDEAIIKRHKLLTMPEEKFILTPHMAYYTQDAINKMEQMAINNVLDMLDKGDCKFVVNR